jgi:hypothetical protein
VTAYQSRILADGASAYWPLDDPPGSVIARDRAGALGGAINGGVTLGVPGVLATGASAMTFNGIDGHIGTGAPLALPTVVTLECWFRLTDATQNPMLSTRDGSDGDRFIFGVYSTRLIMYSASGNFSAAANLNDDQWHHAVAVLDGAMCAFYLNGQLDTSFAFVRTIPGANPIRIGRDGSEYLAGVLQDVAIYPRALTPTEIADHYALQLAPPAPPAHLTMLEAVRARLLQVPEVVALVGDCVTLLISQQSPASRAIRLQEISRVDSAHLRGADDLRTSRIQVDVFVKKGDGDAYAVAHDITDAVRGDFVGGVPTGLVGFRGVVGDVAITSVTGGIQREMFDADELQVVRVLSEYFVWFKHLGGVSPLSPREIPSWT